jgi:stage III sporulation protein AF
MPLRQWLQNLIILVFVVVFLEALLPKNSVRGFVQLVIGLVLIAAILEPMLALTGLRIIGSCPPLVESGKASLWKQVLTCGKGPLPG